ncbi:MAG TPA: glycosyltransferase family 4 protein [Candidatus Limnocylindria bacterium]|nr:glycosyltransferase family 4 protein [Candidatus Limnocylindria bacterium]
MARRRATRVVLVHYTSPRVLGGVEQVMGVHARALSDAGADVTIVAGRGALPAALRGVRLVRIAEVDSKHPRVLRAFAELAKGRVPEDLARLTDRIERALEPHVRRADRVVVHNGLTLHKNHALAAAFERLAARYPGRVIAWTHDLAWTDAQYDGELHDGEPWDRFRHALEGVRYVAVSEPRRDELAALMRLRAAAIAVVPNGVDVPAILGLSRPGAALAERLGLYDADPLLLLPARLTRRKRVEAAIDALRALRSRGTDAGLVVTGAPGAHNLGNQRYLAELRERARGLDRAHVLYALGIRPSYRVIADLFALADAVVMPTGNEGFGIPLLEAALHRVPIVCTDLPTLRALGRDDVTYLEPDADGDAIARAVLRRLRADPEARLRSRAKRHAWPRVLAERVLPVILEGAA